MTLQPRARTALERRDEHARLRLLELHRQLAAEIPLHKIHITADPPRSEEPDDLPALP